jgi:serine/threonine protein kinase
MTDMLVSKARRVGDSSRFIRMDYTIGEQLGAGASATVRRGVCRQTGEAVAIKIFHRSDRAHALDAVREEIRVMQALSGAECCARLVAVYEDWEAIYLVQELAEGGTLTKRIAAAGCRFSEQEAAVLIRGVLTALDALHRRGIAHRDVKLDNILLKSKDRHSAQYLEIRLCDFGLCRALDDRGRKSGAVGTRQFWAPEIVEGICAGGRLRHARPDARCDLKADMWGVGFVLFTLLFGYEPFRNENDSIMFPKILRGASIPACPTTSPGARDLVSRLLSLDPECRPLTQEALQHQWLQQSLGQCVEDGQASDKLIRMASHGGVTGSACRPSVAG